MRSILWLWNSPTFTTWGNYGVQSLRLVVMTPLILNRFDETEIAAWYLFATLNFFGTTVSQRIGLTFSRMIAFAMGGASDLSPIKKGSKPKSDGEPNWGVCERAYGTVGSLTLGIGWVNVIIAFALGWFGLGNILQGYEAKGTIWLAFAFMQLGLLVTFTYQRYRVALVGMNYVAIANRWEMIFSVLSIVAGGMVLLLGGGIVALVVTMQLVLVAGIFRNRILLQLLDEGRVLRFRQYSFDRKVFSWAWEPTWKGFIGQFGLLGSQQLVAIVYTGYGTKSEVASFLFAMRMMQTINQLAQAPFNSVQPKMSRLRAAGHLAELRKLVKERMAASLGLLTLGIVGGAFIFPVAMNLVGSSLAFIPIQAWLLLGGLSIMLRFDVLCCAVNAIGNEMVFYWEMAIAAGVSVIVIVLLRNEIGFYGPIIAWCFPLLVILNFKPYKKAKFVLS